MLRNFFDFNIADTTSTIYLGFSDMFKGDIGDLIKGNYTGIEFPVIFEQDKKGKYTDIIGAQHVSVYLISNKFKDVLEANHLTGWKIFPVKIFDRKGNIVAGYYGFSILGRCLSIHYDTSNIVEKQFTFGSPIRKMYKGISVEEWDGSDFFMPINSFHTFVSPKAANILKNSGLQGIALEHACERLTNEFTVQLHIKKQLTSKVIQFPPQV